MSAEEQPTARLFDRLLAVVLLVGLCLPATLAAIGGGDGVASENRSAKGFPSRPRGLADLERFTRGVDGWWSDHFGGRRALLELRARGIWFGLGASPALNAVRGQDGWIFMRGEGALSSARGALPLREVELAEWELELRSRRDFARSFGAEYLMLIAPGKSHVYGDKLPDRWSTVGPSRMEQFVARMAAAGLPVRHQLEVVRAERERDAPDDLAYWPLGTHWTQRTAFAATLDAQAQAARLVPGVEPLAPQRQQRSPGDAAEDSWSSRLYLEGLLEQSGQQAEYVPRLKARAKPWTPQFARGGYIDPFRRRVMTGAGPRDATLWVSHDSYAQVSIEPLAEAFGRVVASQVQGLPFAQAEEQRPALVLEYYVDRYLFSHAPHWGAPNLQPALEQAFDGLGRPRIPVGPKHPGARRLRARDGAHVEPRANGGAALSFDQPLSRVHLPRRWFGAGQVSCLVALDLEGTAGDVVEFRYALEETTLEERSAGQVTIELDGDRQRTVALLPLYRTQGDPWLVRSLGSGDVVLHSLAVVAASPEDLVERVRGAYSP